MCFKRLSEQRAGWIRDPTSETYTIPPTSFPKHTIRLSVLHATTPPGKLSMPATATSARRSQRAFRLRSPDYLVTNEQSFLQMANQLYLLSPGHLSGGQLLPRLWSRLWRLRQPTTFSLPLNSNVSVLYSPTSCSRCPFRPRHQEAQLRRLWTHTSTTSPALTIVLDQCHQTRAIA